MAVLNPLKVVITNYPEGQIEELDAVNNPEDAIGRHAQGAVLARCCISSGTISWKSRRRKFFRLAPGREVRLRYAYFITCNEVIKDDDGQYHRTALHL